MLTASLLVKKREGGTLTDDEIRFLIDGFCSGAVTDYQMSALMMAICMRGMDAREITTLTEAMLESGDRLPRHQSDRPRVDKHSTGGLGDKVSLVLAPLLAAAGVEVPMVSGRGLGLTGGTLDKLESIEGFETQLSAEQSTRVLREAGTFIVGASDRIAPADRELYALRDVTGTVESVPLITASILSKKLAANLDALVMDVKTGHGALMRTPDQARVLAETLVAVGRQADLRTVALLTDMDQPLGWAIGNAIEVNEAVEVLKGAGGATRELTIELCAVSLLEVGLESDLETAKSQLRQLLDGGDAYERFEKMVSGQGGRLNYPLKVAGGKEIVAQQSGHLAAVDCQSLGEAVVLMGGGRRKKDDRIHASVGVRIQHRIGDFVEAGQPLLTVHCDDGELVNHCTTRLSNAMKIQPDATPSRPLIIERIGL